MSANVPELRFSGFADPWEQRKLGEVAEIVGGGTPSTAVEEYWDGDIDWYSPTEIGDEVYADKSEKTITQAGYESCSATMLPAERTILFTSRAGIGDMAILRRSACTNQGFQSLVIGGWADVYFVYAMGPRIKAYAKRHASGSTFLEISAKQLAKADLCLPSLPEQRAVGALFSRLDSLIALHQRKHNQLSVLKGSLLEGMFPKPGSDVPELRFSGFADPWEQRKFSEVFSFLRNNTLSRAELSDTEGSMFNVHYGDVLVKFGEVVDANRDILPRIADDGLAARLSCPSLADGDVIIADTAEDEAVGKCSELRGCDGKGIVSGLHTIACRPMLECASRYLGYYLNSPSFHNQLLPLMQGIKVISVSKGAIGDTEVCFPSFPEQRAVGALFSRLDSLIALHQRKLEKLRALKQSLLQKMFV